MKTIEIHLVEPIVIASNYLRHWRIYAMTMWCQREHNMIMDFIALHWEFDTQENQSIMACKVKGYRVQNDFPTQHRVEWRNRSYAREMTNNNTIVVRNDGSIIHCIDPHYCQILFKLWLIPNMCLVVVIE